jgi:hypothetical protein
MAVWVGGCGGGGGSGILPPTTHDLSSIQGTWDSTMTFQGIIKAGGDTLPLNDNITGYYVITPNSVTGSGGGSLSWSYNGVILLLQNGVSLTDWSADCGNMYISGTAKFQIPCNASTRVTTITGNLTASGTTDYCGNLSMSGTYNGTLTKRD